MTKKSTGKAGNGEETLMGFQSDQSSAAKRRGCISLTTVYELAAKDARPSIPVQSVMAAPAHSSPAGEFLVTYYGYRATRLRIAELTRDAKAKGNRLEIARLTIDIRDFLEGGTVHLADIHRSRLLNLLDASVELSDDLLRVMIPALTDPALITRITKSSVPKFLAEYPEYLDVLRRAPHYRHITVFVVPGQKPQSIAYVFPGAKVVDAQSVSGLSVDLPTWLHPDRAIKAAKIPKQNPRATVAVPVSAQPVVAAAKKKPTR